MTKNFLNNSEGLVEGWLRKDGDQLFIENDNGEKLFSGGRIWEGYAARWLDKKALARELPQVDDVSGLPIVLVWPAEDIAYRKDRTNYIEIYYNERLTQYWSSFLGHIAVNVGGRVFNFSNKIGENEELSPEEYFYRPLVGEFLPRTDKICGITNKPLPPCVNFGRRFMRSIHILRVEGDKIDTEKLLKIFREKLNEIRNAPIDHNHPGDYAEFSFFSSSCATIIRDGLRKGGFKSVSGVCPRDFFVSCAKGFKKLSKDHNLSVSYRFMPQLLVPEAPPSKLTPLLNPLNYYRKYKYLDKLPMEKI